MNENTSEEKDLVSVIIPAYNHQDYIQECIDSIARQTYPDIELLVLDDGSSDQTYEKIEEALKRYPDRFKRVWSEKQENTGKTGALNRLIEQSRGEYIYIVDSDDVAKPWAIEMNWDFLRNNPDYVLSVGDNEFIDANSMPVFYSKDSTLTHDEGQAYFRTFADCYNLRYMGKDAFGTYAALFNGNHIPNGYFIRASMLKKMPKFTTEAPMEDYYMMLQLSKCYKFNYIDEVLFSRRMHMSNVSNNSKHMDDMCYKTSEYEIKNMMREENLPENILPEVKRFIENVRLRVKV